MNDFTSLKLKCAAMGFADIESLERIANESYSVMIARATSEKDKNGLKLEKEEFSQAIEKVKSEKAFDFINNE